MEGRRSIRGYKPDPVDIAVQLFQAMGIERHDAERRQDWVLRGFRQFDAPISVVSQRRSVDEVASFIGFE